MTEIHEEARNQVFLGGMARIDATMRGKTRETDKTPGKKRSTRLASDARSGLLLKRRMVEIRPQQIESRAPRLNLRPA